MGHLWQGFGCFLTGYNYRLLKLCSEASAKALKKYTAALLIISIIWGFIGFTFTDRYLHGSLYGSIAGAVIMIVVVIQIERQIILTVGRPKAPAILRGLIGVIMAIIGSVILDQIMFKEDIEKQKLAEVDNEVNRILPARTAQIDSLLHSLDAELAAKQSSLDTLIPQFNMTPVISLADVTVTSEADSSGEFRPVARTVGTKNIPNPQGDLISQQQSQMSSLREIKTTKETDKLTIREDLREELRARTGFLDELDVLLKVLLSSTVALVVWILWFLFLVFIELFVLVSKYADRENDYDKMVLHQLDVRCRMIDRLSREGPGEPVPSVARKVAEVAAKALGPTE